MWSRLNPGHDRLPAALRPSPVTVELPAIERVEEAERELARHARADDHRCWGYFPSLTGRPGIHADLPACRDFASVLPEIIAADVHYRFNFIRLSLRCQSQQPAYHLDSDAATALTGDLATLAQRRVGRLLLNLSTTEERNLYYLDLDVSAARPAVRAAIPPRSGQTAHGICFVANHVLHSGVDGPNGHFVAAYGYDCLIPVGIRER
jgi:hypothetical protein